MRAFAFAIEHLAVPAFVVFAGRVVVANPMGTAWLAQPGNADALVGTSRPQRTVFDSVAFDIAGATYHFAIARTRAPLEAGRALPPATSWGLTRRETEVAARLLRGDANRRIAAELACTLKTVEHHVSSILHKAKVPSRARLILAARDGRALVEAEQPESGFPPIFKARRG